MPARFARATVPTKGDGWRTDRSSFVLSKEDAAIMTEPPRLRDIINFHQSYAGGAATTAHNCGVSAGRKRFD